MSQKPHCRILGGFIPVVPSTVGEKRMRKKAFFKLFCILIISSGLYGGPGNTQQDPRIQLERLSGVIEGSLQQSTEEIVKENYQGAIGSAQNALQGLDVLIDAVMPLNRRIEKLLRDEKEILAATRQKQAGFTSDGKSREAAELDDLIFDQIRNREASEKAAKIAARQRNAVQAPDSDPTADGMAESLKQKEVLQEIESLLSESAEFQTQAIASLEKRDPARAIPQEEQAVEKLEKALEKFQGDSRNQQQEQDQRDGHQQQNQNRQATASKQNPEKNGGESSDRQAEKDEGTSTEDARKMSPKDAIRQLLRLQKQAEDEKRARERKYGIQDPERKMKVEKDW